MELAICGWHQEYGGAGVIHKQLTDRLPLALGPDWHCVAVPILGSDVRPSLIARYLSHIHRTADVVLLTGTPQPLRCHGVVVPLIYDLRWAWTGTWAHRLYRRAELARTLRRSNCIATISATVAAQLGYVTRMSQRVEVLAMGPGQFEDWGFSPPVNAHHIVLMGAAMHKNNIQAAQLLADSQLVKKEYVVTGINLPAEAEATLRKALPSSQFHALRGIDQQALASVLGSASVYIALGTSEGFGLPYVEAAYFGCDVIAPLHPLAIEVLGEDGNFVSFDRVTSADLERALGLWDSDRVKRLQSRSVSRSWSQTVIQAADLVRSAWASRG